MFAVKLDVEIYDQVGDCNHREVAVALDGGGDFLVVDLRLVGDPKERIVNVSAAKLRRALAYLERERKADADAS